MGRKFKVWLDSGANHTSKYGTETDLDDIGVSSDAWDKMSTMEKDDVMREVALESCDWGYSEIKDKQTTVKEAMDRAIQIQSIVWIWTDDMVTGYAKRDEWIEIDPVSATFNRVNINYVSYNHGFSYNDLIRSDWKIRERKPIKI